MRLPCLLGAPIRVEIRPSLGPYHAATSIPGRRIQLDRGVLDRRGEFERILIHELFHFVWVRLGNAARRSWEDQLRREAAARTRGELGWSAEWRKHQLSAADVRSRSPRWRRYACESFCDTAAWRYAGIHGHDEFTLPARARHGRGKWFAASFPAGAGIRV